MHHEPIPSGTYYANSSINGNSSLGQDANVSLHAGAEIHFQPNITLHYQVLALTHLLKAAQIHQVYNHLLKKIK